MVARRTYSRRSSLCDCGRMPVFNLYRNGRVNPFGDWRTYTSGEAAFLFIAASIDPTSPILTQWKCYRFSISVSDLVGIKPVSQNEADSFLRLDVGPVNTTSKLARRPKVPTHLQSDT